MLEKITVKDAIYNIIASTDWKTYGELKDYHEVICMVRQDYNALGKRISKLDANDPTFADLTAQRAKLFTTFNTMREDYNKMSREFNAQSKAMVGK